MTLRNEFFDAITKVIPDKPGFLVFIHPFKISPSQFTL